MATRTIKMPNGTELTLSSNELEAGDWVVRRDFVGNVGGAG